MDTEDPFVSSSYSSSSSSSQCCEAPLLSVPFALPSFKTELGLLRLLGFAPFNGTSSPFLGFLGELLLLLLGLELDLSFLGLDDRLGGFALASDSSSLGPCFLLTFLAAASDTSDFFRVFFGDEPFWSFCLALSTVAAAVTVLLTLEKKIKFFLLACLLFYMILLYFLSFTFDDPEAPAMICLVSMTFSLIAAILSCVILKSSPYLTSFISSVLESS